MAEKARVVILGGGPAGVGAAWKLQKEGRARVVLLERGDHYGGNAGSFADNGHFLDYGSHRLHRATEPEILADIRSLLGDDLLDRPRRGRIRLMGRWIHFPLKPGDLLLRLPPAFALGSLRDALARALPTGRDEGDTFGSVLSAKLGRTICDHFYFPYAIKLWGHPADELSGIQARRRVAASSFTKLIAKVMTQMPGLKKPGAGNFYYPARGYGQISEAYAEAAAGAGADMRLGWEMKRLERPQGAGGPWRVHAKSCDASETFEADQVWSTIPIPPLARAMDPAPPADVLEAAGAIDYRAMILIYAYLDVDFFSDYDAHYFPDGKTRITRMSEPKIYGARSEPRGRTVLCAELPCFVGDEHWKQSDEDLGRLLAEDLRASGIPLPVEPGRVATRRLPAAYPVYRLGYERPLEVLDRWVHGVDGLLSYGRQGLFAHDNLHHALYMAYCAAGCLQEGRFDERRWADHLEEFEGHVVVD